MEQPLPPQDPVTAPAAPPPPESARPLRVEFTGDGGSYFGIWIVNLILTIVTIGIYSPWAKARRLRYFYGNTLLDGSPFEFHGSPIAMLKGRIIACVLFLAYSQSAKYSLTAWLAVVGFIAAILPWLLWKSLRFRLHNSSYRGIRFEFTGSLGAAYGVFVPFGLLVVVPAALALIPLAHVSPGHPPDPASFVPLAAAYLAALAALPWLYQRLKRYQHDHSRLGQLPFSFTGTVGQAYLLGLKFLGMILVAVALAAGSGYLIARSVHLDAGTSFPLVAFLGLLVGYLLMLCSLPVTTAMMQNFVWGSTQLGARPFRSHVAPLSLLGIDAVNFVAMVLSLGLFWPFALVRHVRYRVACLEWSGEPASIQAAGDGAAVAAVGEEAAEMFGFDIGL